MADTSHHESKGSEGRLKELEVDIDFRALEPHRLSEKFSKYDIEEEKSMIQDIYQKGLKNRIVLYWNETKRLYEIADGNLRFNCLVLLFAEFKKEYFNVFIGTETELEEFLITENVIRKHLPKWRKALMAVPDYKAAKQETKLALSKKMSMIRKGLKTKSTLFESSDSAKRIAKKWGISTKYLIDAETLMDHYTDLYDEVDSGAMSFSEAMKLIREGKQDASTETEQNEPNEVSEKVQKPQDQTKQNNNKIKPLKISADLYTKLNTIAKESKMDIEMVLSNLINYYFNNQGGKNE